MFSDVVITSKQVGTSDRILLRGIAGSAPFLWVTLALHESQGPDPLQECPTYMDLL